MARACSPIDAEAAPGWPGQGARQRSRSDAEGALDAVAQAQTMRASGSAGTGAVGGSATDTRQAPRNWHNSPPRCPSPRPLLHTSFPRPIQLADPHSCLKTQTYRQRSRVDAHLGGLASTVCLTVAVLAIHPAASGDTQPASSIAESRSLSRSRR